MSDIKTQAKEGTEEAINPFKAFLIDAMAKLNGDAALKASVIELTEKITARDAEVLKLKADLAAKDTAHATAISELKATHATELTAATNKAQTDLAKTGHSRIPADTGTDTSGGGQAKTKKDQYNALIASGDPKAAGEFYAANRDEILKGN